MAVFSSATGSAIGSATGSATTVVGGKVEFAGIFSSRSSGCSIAWIGFGVIAGDSSMARLLTMTLLAATGVITATLLECRL